ncbi:hypothetical protein COLO4_30085 [Corchorus olitorius]|uniref:Uncharacterized protein n=1 Tax=Corchorus olitorius TaxID=93759 RepID=A0A1R3HBA2_9ROSI|nr:hypothetical protein COLO4_30085 [Corchorus olitorius]
MSTEDITFQLEIIVENENPDNLRNIGSSLHIFNIQGSGTRLEVIPEQDTLSSEAEQSVEQEAREENIRKRQRDEMEEDTQKDPETSRCTRLRVEEADSAQEDSEPNENNTKAAEGLRQAVPQQPPKLPWVSFVGMSEDWVDL